MKLKFEKQCEICGLPQPIPEYKFHPTRKWRVDWYFPQYHLAIEQEGGIWIIGRHNRPASMIRDMGKYNELTIRGIFLLRFTPKQIKNGEAVSQIFKFTRLLPLTI